MKNILRLVVLSCLLAPVAHADLIASRTGTYVEGVLDGPGDGPSWSQSQTYTDVSIVGDFAALVAGGGSGTIYLTDMIGPGTTPANLIAEVSVSGVTENEVNAITLFSGLTLGPGTYYLVQSLGVTGDDIGWILYELGFAGNVEAHGPGDTVGTDYQPAYYGESIPAFPPAELLVTSPTARQDGFQVTGQPTPEPSTFLLLGTGLLGVVGVVRRRAVLAASA